MKFYFCKHCKKVIVSSSAICCSEEMKELKANTEDASLEKHVPVIQKKEDNYLVKVGETIHPMEEDHYITFICLELKDGYMIKYLKPGMEPMASFKTDESPVAVYEYCNLHGLWKKDL